MTDDRMAEGLDHLQVAALEMIRAARAFLDVAEDLVSDRDKVAEVVDAFGTIAEAATRAAQGEAPRARRAGAGADQGPPAEARSGDRPAGDDAAGDRAGDAAGGTGGRARPGGRPDRVEHIEVS